MEVPTHISQMTESELVDWVSNTPKHNPTPLEIYLVTEHEFLNDFEDQIEELEKEVENTQDDLRNAKDNLENIESELTSMETERDEWQEQTNQLNVTFPTDLIKFCKEARAWQTNNAMWKKQLTQRSSEMITLETERNRVVKENMDLKLQIKMYDAAGLEKNE